MNNEPCGEGCISRRHFLVLTATAVAGCVTATTSVNSTAAHGERTVDAGPVGNYAADGVYGNFRDQGFFIVRQGAKLFAISAICTHRKCKLNAEPDHTFYCECHGSTFDPGGKVTEGPAKRDLPVFPTSPGEGQHLLVKVPVA